MARHHFGIMDKAPVSGKRYDSYEPDKYDLIAVDDDFIEPILPELEAVNCFCHTTDIPCRGLMYTGITLIPPESADIMSSIIGGIIEKYGILEFCELKETLIKAKAENKFVIHYGL